MNAFLGFVSTLVIFILKLFDSTKDIAEPLEWIMYDANARIADPNAQRNSAFPVVPEEALLLVENAEVVCPDFAPPTCTLRYAVENALARWNN